MVTKMLTFIIQKCKNTFLTHSLFEMVLLLLNWSEGEFFFANQTQRTDGAVERAPKQDLHRKKLSLVRQVSQRITSSSIRTQTSPQDSQKTRSLLSWMYSRRKKGGVWTSSRVGIFPHTVMFRGFPLGEMTFSSILGLSQARPWLSCHTTRSLPRSNRISFPPCLQKLSL